MPFGTANFELKEVPLRENKSTPPSCLIAIVAISVQLQLVLPELCLRNREAISEFNGF
jgi:hypothetical protein